MIKDILHTWPDLLDGGDTSKIPRWSKRREQLEEMWEDVRGDFPFSIILRQKIYVTSCSLCNENAHIRFVMFTNHKQCPIL